MRSLLCLVLGISFKLPLALCQNCKTSDFKVDSRDVEIFTVNKEMQLYRCDHPPGGNVTCVTALKGEADFDENNVILPHNKSCQYRDGYCYYQGAVMVIWKVEKWSMCERFIQIATGPFQHWIMEDQQSVQFVISERKSDPLALQLKEEEEHCGVKFWKTTVPDVFVTFNASNLKKYEKNETLHSEFNFKNRQQAVRMILAHCKMDKQRVKGNFFDQISKNILLLYLLGFFLIYILLSLVITVFNIFVNCCTLRNIKKRHKKVSCLYIFNCFCSSLTHRFVYSKLRTDISNLEMEVYGSKVRREMEKHAKDYGYVDNDLYTNSNTMVI